MSEVPICHADWLKVVDPDVHVQASLNIIFGNATLLELLGSFSHRKGNSLVFLRKPTALCGCLFFLVSLFLVLLTEKGSDRLDSFLELHLAVVSSRNLLLHVLGLSSVAKSVVLGKGVFALILGYKIRVFLGGRVLWEGGFEVRTVHFDVADYMHIGAIYEILFLKRFDLRMRMS